MGATIPQLLVSKGRLTEFKRALELGGDLHQLDDQGRSALHYAFLGRWGKSRNESIELVSYLLESGSDVSRKDMFDSTPLHYAASAWGPDNIKMLLHHGADPDIQNQLNETALHAAVHPNNIYWNKEAEDVALALIDGGADANVAGQYENTPLHYAVKSNMHRVIRALVEHGASLEAADTFFGGMPIHVAAIDLGPRPVHSGAGWSPTIRTSPETLAMLSLLVELGSDVV
jgi:ankyrin repeat protein